MKYLIKWKRWLCFLGLFSIVTGCLGCQGMSGSLVYGGSVVTQEGATEETKNSEETVPDQESGTAKEGGTTQKSAESEAVQGGEFAQDSEEGSSTGDTTSSETIFVHVCGCVKEPGLYEFPVQIRAGEAIEEAGGFTKKADQTAVNLAQILSDGMQLYIPAQGEAGGTSASGASAGNSTSNSMSGQTDTSTDSGNSGEEEDFSGASAVGTDGKLNINEATVEELMTLSGIGEARAEAILSYRDENGSFSSIEDIKNVSGIGEGIFDKIKDKITV